MAVLITNSELGIYLGNCLGLGFWSKLDPVGQPSAVTFDSEDEARNHVEIWDNPLDDYQLVHVEPDDGWFITSEAVAKYGLDSWDYGE